MPLDCVCVHCHRKFVDETTSLAPGSKLCAFAVCAECKVLAEEDRLPPPFGQTYLCYPVGAAMIPLVFAFLLPIGDYRGWPDHWNVDLNARLSYLAMLLPVGLIWSTARRGGQYVLLLVFALLIAYPFMANSWLGPEARLINPRFRTEDPAIGAGALWLAALGVGAGLKDMFLYPERFGPHPLEYRRSFAGFCKSLLLALTLLYLGGLAYGYWRSGEWGLRLQAEVGLWRTGLLGLPLAYFFWSLGSAFQDTSREIAEQDEIRRQGNRPPKA